MTSSPGAAKAASFFTTSSARWQTLLRCGGGSSKIALPKTSMVSHAARPSRVLLPGACILHVIASAPLGEAVLPTRRYRRTCVVAHTSAGKLGVSHSRLAPCTRAPARAQEEPAPERSPGAQEVDGLASRPQGPSAELVEDAPGDSGDRGDRLAKARCLSRGRRLASVGGLGAEPSRELSGGRRDRGRPAPQSAQPTWRAASQSKRRHSRGRERAGAFMCVARAAA